VLQTCAGGVYQDTQTCAAACDAALGCVACAPSTATCVGSVSHACLPDGSGFVDMACDPAQGLACGPSGTCEGPCAPGLLGQSHLGCDFRPTVTGNPVAGDYHFAIAVANPAAAAATVTVDGGGLSAPVTFAVPAGGARVQALPWVAALKLCVGATSADCTGTQANAALAAGGAFRVRATSPVAVYQYNPLEYAIAAAGDPLSYSNDASLLFPETSWGRTYYVASWTPAAGQLPGLLTVTAAQDATTVVVTTRASTAASGGAPAFAAGVPQSVTLDAGGVLEIGSLTGDLTGSLVQADKPVQVLGGHYCAQVPDGVAYCDHLEEAMPPVEALGRRYLVSAPATPATPGGKEEVIRLVAAEAGTTLSYDPPQAGAPTAIANPGDFVEIARQPASFQVTANHKILVAQYMEGQMATAGNDGDPSMSVATPVEQYRSSYRFHAPTNYVVGYLDVLAPTGASISLDGAPVSGFAAIGTSGYGLARVSPLGSGPGTDGSHLITGDQPFGISVYGYGDSTSYWYPGGLDLAPIP